MQETVRVLLLALLAFVMLGVLCAACVGAFLLFKLFIKDKRKSPELTSQREFHGAEMYGDEPVDRIQTRIAGSPEFDLRPWVLRVGAELPNPVTSGCGDDDCNVAAILPVDLYCETHERFLPLSAQVHTTGWWAATAGLGISACAAVVATAQLETPVPVFAMMACLAAAVVLLPVRRYPATRSALAVMYVVALATTIALYSTSVEAQKVTRTGLVCILVGIWTFMLWFAAIRGGWDVPKPGTDDSVDLETGAPNRGIPGRKTVAGVVGLATITPAALLVYALFAVDSRGWFLEPASVERLLLRTAVAGLIGAAVIALVYGVIEGSSIDRHVNRKLQAPRPPRRMQWRRPRVSRAHGRDPLERVAQAASKLGNSLLGGSLRVAAAAANLVRKGAYVLRRASVRAINWVHCLFTLFLRRIRSSLAAAGSVLLRAFVIFLPSAKRATRVFLIPMLAVTAVGLVCLAAAEDMEEYLLDGSFEALALAAAEGLALIVAANISWMVLSGLQPPLLLASAQRTWTISGPYGLVILAVGGWLVGLPGTFGHGPIHVGWVTMASTLVLLCAYVWTRFAAQSTDGSAPIGSGQPL